MSLTMRWKEARWNNYHSLKAWAVTVPDTYAISYIDETAESARSAANKAVTNILEKYNSLAKTYYFVSIAIETVDL